MDSWSLDTTMLSEHLNTVKCLSVNFIIYYILYFWSRFINSSQFEFVCLQPLGTPNMSSLPRSPHKSPRSPEVMSPVSRPDLLCDMKDDNTGNVRTLAEAIDEEVIALSIDSHHRPNANNLCLPLFVDL